MSKEALDGLVRRAVADGGFRARLNDPDRFEEAIAGCDLTPEETRRLKRVTSEKGTTILPYAEGLNERLAK